MEIMRSIKLTFCTQSVIFLLEMANLACAPDRGAFEIKIVVQHTVRRAVVSLISEGKGEYFFLDATPA